jgi:SAM-dependent methyltransferase
VGDLLRAARRNVGQLLFERRYRVHTAGRKYLDEFDAADDERVYYVAANWLTLRRLLRRSEIHPDDVFIDLGSGMGRMVLEAARYPFKRVIGVELVEQLHDAARANLVSTRQRLRCRDIVLVCSDALDYELPDDITVVFLNNPFRGQILARVVEKLIASVDENPRPVTVIYDNPVEDQTLLSTGRFVRQRTISHVPLRRVTSAFGSTSVYALTPRS